MSDPGSVGSGQEKVVGIVLVSHSRAVAESVAELATGSRAAMRSSPWHRRAAPRTAGSAPAPS